MTPCPVCQLIGHQAVSHAPQEVLSKLLSLHGELISAQEEARTWMDEARRLRPIARAAEEVLFNLSLKLPALRRWAYATRIRSALLEGFKNANAERVQGTDFSGPREV